MTPNKNCLVILTATWETGLPEPIVRIKHFDAAMDALNVYANTPCHWSQLCTEEDADRIAKKAMEMYKACELDEDTYIS
jgi:hypothetical protein